MAKRPQRSRRPTRHNTRRPTRHNTLLPRGKRQPTWHERYPEERYNPAGPHTDARLIPAKSRRRPPALPYGVLPDVVVLCGRPRDGVPCSGVVYQMECYTCGSRDTLHRQAYRRAGADALAAATDKMSARGGRP